MGTIKVGALSGRPKRAIYIYFDIKILRADSLKRNQKK